MTTYGRDGRCFESSISTKCNWQHSGAVWKLRWPSWAFCPNEPYSFCGCKATLNHAYTLVTVCPKYVNLTSEDIKLYIIMWKLWESCGRRWRRSCHSQWPAIVPNNMSRLGLSTRWLCRWDVSHLVSRGGIDDEMRSSLTLQQEWQTETPIRQVQIYKHSQVMKVCRLWPRSDLAQRPWSWNWKWYWAME